MAYKKSKEDPEWKEFISPTRVQRQLECSIDDDKRHQGWLYNCSSIDLFELGASNYPLYLLNIRIPQNRTLCHMKPQSPNCQLGFISDLRLIEVHQNGGFTLIWLWLKTLATPAVVASTMWYSGRVDGLNRPRRLIEKAILALGWAMAVLDCKKWSFGI